MIQVPASVLAAVDFGEASARAVEIGGFLAERCHASSLRLLHSESIEAPIYFTSEQIERLERERVTARARAAEFLQEFGRLHTPTPFSAGIETLPPVDAILRASTASELVVMGTHGRHGLTRWWLGSVAERVLRETRRPLLIVRADQGQPVTSLFDRVVVHATAPLTGTATLQFAQGLGACLGGEIIDKRYEPIEPALNETRATILLAALPEPRTSAWLSDIGEPLVRFCSVPILFVPEIARGALP